MHINIAPLRFRPAVAGSLLAILLFCISPAEASDVTAQINITKSGLVLNRATNTFDSTIKITNIGAGPLKPPLRLFTIIQPSPTPAAPILVQNATGLMPDGRKFIELTPTGGQLNQGQSVQTIVKMFNPTAAKFTVNFAVEAMPTDLPGLPPDPGPAGQATLLGVDADGDGIRDDVARYIVSTYGDKPNAVNALNAVARTYQKMLQVPPNDAAAARAINDVAWRQRSCLVYLFNVDQGHMMAADVFAEHFNTVDRYRAWSNQDYLLAGEVFDSPRDRSQTCDFSIVR